MRRILTVCVLLTFALLVTAQEGVDAPHADHPLEENEYHGEHVADELLHSSESALQTELHTEVDADGNPIANPNYEEELKRLIKLCKTIKSEMHDIFSMKQFHKHETGILARAGVIGEHLETTHEQWDVEHHTWDCAKAREVMKHEHVADFIKHFERWYDGKDLVPPVSHARMVQIVTHLKDELAALRLSNGETDEELQSIILDLNALEKWHLDLRKSYDDMMHESNSATCEKPFQAFIKTLMEMHGDHIPEWYHVSEGVNLLLAQCQEDPAINPEL